MPKKLTPKQRGFANDYLKTGNGTTAVLNNYNVKTPEVAASIASENLRKPNVRDYLENKAERAAEIVFELAETSQMDNVRLGASKDILDRAGLKPVERSISVHVEVTDSPEIRKLTQELNALYKGN